MSNLHSTRLRQFLDAAPHGGASALANRLGIHSVYLAQLAARKNERQPSAELCVDIERETGGDVRRWDLRPKDWHRIWPELIGTPGAPPAAPTTTALEATHAGQ